MKKLLFSLILLMCVIMPSLFLFSSCGGKTPISVKGKTFGLDKIDAAWAKDATSLEKRQAIEYYGLNSEKELFDYIKNSYNEEYSFVLFTFLENGTCSAFMLTGTYEQKGENLYITIMDETKQMKVNGNKLELQMEETKSSAIIVTFIFKQVKPTTPSVPETSDVIGETFSLVSVSTKWIDGTTEAQKQNMLESNYCQTEEDYFELNELGFSNLTLTFDEDLQCLFKTEGPFSVNINYLFSETETTVSLIMMGAPFMTFTKSENQLTSTQVLEESYIEQTIILQANT